jgi:hypothetical protein
VLRAILDVPVPKTLCDGIEGTRLCDLDASVWRRLSRAACQQLAEVVVDTVRKGYQCRSRNLLTIPIPSPPAGVKLEDLELQPRTFNCLSKARLRMPFNRLGAYRISDLRDIRGFGVRCLLDLLTALEGIGAAGVEDDDGTDAAAVIRAAKRMRSHSYADAVLRDDLRLGEYVRALSPKAATLGAALDHLIAAQANVANPTRTAQVLAALRSRIAVCLRQRLERELWDFTSPAGIERNRTMAAKYFGWDGAGERTLQTVADEYSLTRERVRQVASRVTVRLSGKRPFAPALDKVAEYVADRTPGVVADLVEGLLAEGLTERRFDLSVLPAAATAMGRELTFEIVRQHGRLLAVFSEGGDLASDILRAARRAVEHWGATTIDDIVARVEGASKEVTSSILSGRPDFAWLDEASGWFWLSSVPRNRLRNQIEKIVAVANRIDIGELRSGVGRHHRMKGFAPPRRVLLEFCRQMPAYRVEGQTVVCDPATPIEEVLSESEQTMYRVLHKEGPIMQRLKLEERCLAAGMSRSAFYMFLEYSPVFARYARGVYGLRGAAVSPGVVESLIPTVKRHRVIRDYGWDEDGRIWLAFQVSDAMANSGVFGIPAAMKHFLEGEFGLVTLDGERMGTLVSRESGAWGLRPFFRRRGIEEGDQVVLRFDLKARSATVEVGDSMMLEELQEAEPGSSQNG